MCHLSDQTGMTTIAIILSEWKLRFDKTQKTEISLQWKGRKHYINSIQQFQIKYICKSLQTSVINRFIVIGSP